VVGLLPERAINSATLRPMLSRALAMRSSRERRASSSSPGLSMRPLLYQDDRRIVGD
jgi:hypothetical protein